MVSPSRIVAIPRKPIFALWRSLPLIVTAGLMLVGCSNATTEPKPADAPYMASGGVPAKNSDVASNRALQRLAEATADSETSPIPAPESSQAGNPIETGPATATPGQTSPRPQNETTRNPAGPVSDPAVGRTQLRPELTPAELVQFLGVADRDMQDIWSRLPQIPGGRDELIRIAKMKLEAARRLKASTEADESSKSAGARGELQALSHLASFSDLKSAKELEDLATENLQSNDPELVADSRLVLIGFALEGLQNGEVGAADRVIGFIDQIAATGNASDVPTLMVMGQSRDALAAYGHEEHANRVRDAIIELYADSPNPDLATAAAELAGNILFDDIDQLLAKALNGQTVAVDQWRTAVDQLIAKAPAIRTVEYLAGAALQLEAIEQDELVQTTFDGMTNVFQDPNVDTGREVRIAMAARDARRDIVGVRFNPVLPSVDGTTLSMDPYQGRVVLVPFWAAAFPESLQLIGMLKEIQAAHPDDIAIVGVNLDGNDALLQEFTDQNDLGFPSFRSKSSAEAEVANPLAAQFGIASMPFLAIVDRKGQVAAINFTGRGIQAKIEQLLSQ